MTQYDFSSLPRPGIQNKSQIAMRSKLFRMRNYIKDLAREYRASGHTTKAARAELALQYVTHELMRMGAFR